MGAWVTGAPGSKVTGEAGSRGRASGSLWGPPPGMVEVDPQAPPHMMPRLLLPTSSNLTG